MVSPYAALEKNRSFFPEQHCRIMKFSGQKQQSLAATWQPLAATCLGSHLQVTAKWKLKMRTSWELNVNSGKHASRLPYFTLEPTRPSLGGAKFRVSCCMACNSHIGKSQIEKVWQIAKSRRFGRPSWQFFSRPFLPHEGQMGGVPESHSQLR